MLRSLFALRTALQRAAQASALEGALQQLQRAGLVSIARAGSWGQVSGPRKAPHVSLCRRVAEPGLHRLPAGTSARFMAPAAAAARQRGPASQVGGAAAAAASGAACVPAHASTRTSLVCPCCSHAAEELPEPYYHKIVDHTLDDLLERLEVRPQRVVGAWEVPAAGCGSATLKHLLCAMLSFV